MDENVKSILKSISEFHEEKELTVEQAKAIEEAIAREPVKMNVRELPLRKIRHDA